MFSHVASAIGWLFQLGGAIPTTFHAAVVFVIIAAPWTIRLPVSRLAMMLRLRSGCSSPGRARGPVQAKYEKPPRPHERRSPHLVAIVVRRSGASPLWSDLQVPLFSKGLASLPPWHSQGRHACRKLAVLKAPESRLAEP